MSEAIGIMDSAYFVPRQELLNWINEKLQLNLEKIEDLGSGAVYCQLLDAAFGQIIPMGKVNWKAKFSYEFIQNLKIFQDGLQKLMITRKIDIQKLAKAKYQDNLELIQWLKRYVQLHGEFKPIYNPRNRRNNAQLLENSKMKKALLPTSKKKLTNQVLSPRSKDKVTKVLFQRQKENMKVPEEKTKLQKIKQVLEGPLGQEQKLLNIEEIIYGKRKGNHEEEQVF